MWATVGILIDQSFLKTIRTIEDQRERRSERDIAERVTYCVYSRSSINWNIGNKQTGMCSKNTQLTESKKQHSFGLEKLEFLVNE